MLKILKTIYPLIPFKIELYSLLKKIYVPPFYRYFPVKGEYKVYWDARNYFKINSDYNLFMENEIFWLGLFGGWEKKSLEVWVKICKYSSNIFDIGANSGIYSLIAQSVNPEAKVYAFEPISANLELLKRNVFINRFSIKPVEAAVSNYNGTATMYALPDTVNYMTSVNKNRYENKKVTEIKVKTVMLSEYIQKEHINKVDLIKIDVEEHEFEVLQGFEPYIRTMQPSFLIEIIGDENGKKIMNFFSDSDYLYFLIDEIHDPVQVESIIDMEHHNYFICMPEIAKKINLI